MKFRTVLIVFLGLGLIGSLFPFETVVVPEWKIQVVEKSGQPLSAVPLRETWKDYSIEAEGHEEALASDTNGIVIFGKRTVKANLWMRIFKTTANMINPHGSTGPTASIYVLAPFKAISEEPSYTPGQPLTNRITVE